MKIQDRNAGIKELDKLKSKIEIGESLTEKDLLKVISLLKVLLRTVKID